MNWRAAPTRTFQRPPSQFPNHLAQQIVNCPVAKKSLQWPAVPCAPPPRRSKGASFVNHPSRLHRILRRSRDLAPIVLSALVSVVGVGALAGAASPHDSTSWTP